jgi:MFS transporter, AAHS family, 4-hydroxybenzoate transporter
MRLSGFLSESEMNIQAEVGSPGLSGSLDIAALVDGKRVGLFHLWLVVILFLVELAEGYDLGIAGIIAPGLVKEFSMAPAMLGFFFSAGIAGMILGAFIFAFVGDRYGRKAGITVGILIFGGFTFASAYAPNLQSLVALRFLTGVGLAGTGPNLVSLMAEYLPKRVRSLLAGLVLTGVPVGTILAAASSGLIDVERGWRTLLLLGGGASVLLGVALIWCLPESLSFLALRASNRARLIRVVKSVYGLTDLPLDIAVTMEPTGAPSAKVGFSPAGILAKQYRVATCLLWCLCFLNYGMGFYIFNWAPTIFHALAFSAQDAGFLVSVLALGGFVGGIAMSALMMRWGVLFICVFYAVLIPALLMVGATPGNVAHTAFWAVLVGFAVGGGQTALYVISGIIYATPVRATGSGWASGAGRIGACLGPLAGSLLLGVVPMKQLFIGPAAVVPVGLAASVALTLLLRRRLGGYRVRELASGESHRMV